MRLEELRKLDARELEAMALIACCGWRWLRHRSGQRLCTFQPPEPAQRNVAGQWQPFPWGPNAYEEVDGIPPDEDRLSDWWNGGCLVSKGGFRRYGMPRPSESIADAWELEEAIENAGKKAEYTWNLCRTTPPLPDEKEWRTDLWTLIHASPLDRTLAAILTMEGSRDAF